MQKLSHRDVHIDALRGIATVFVIVHHYARLVVPIYHAEYMGFWGVKLFFIISGYLLLGSFQSSVKQGENTARGIRIYARKRLWRILPAYYVNLLFVLLVFCLTTADQWWLLTPGFAWQVVQHITLIVFFITKAVGFGLNDSYWTLCLEAMWYVAVPFLYLFCNTPRRIGYIILAAILYIAAIDMGWLDWILQIHTQQPPTTMGLLWLSCQLPGQMLFFGIGILLWQRRQFLRESRLPLWAAIVLCLALPVAYMGEIFHSLTAQNLLHAALTTVTFITVVTAAMHEKDLFSKIIAWLGKISYSLYLWNFPLLLLLRRMHMFSYMPPIMFAPLYALCLIAVSAASYYGIERWGLKYAHPKINS